MSGSKPLMAVGDRHLQRQIRLAITMASDHDAAFHIDASPEVTPARRLVILSSQELSRYQVRNPARLQFLKQRTCMIVVVQQPEAGTILEAIRVADGLVFCEMNLHHLTMIAALAASGYMAIPPVLASQLINRGIRRELMLSLNLIERRVLGLLGHGSSNRTISEALALDEGRTKYLIRSVFKKLHLQNRTQAAVFARDLMLDAAPPDSAYRSPAGESGTFNRQLAVLTS